MHSHNFLRRPDADELAIQEVAKMIENAKMPLLLIGAGANRKRTCRALTDFIEQTASHFLIYKWEKVLYMSVAEHIGQLKEEHVPMGLTKDHLIMIKLFS